MASKRTKEHERRDALRDALVAHVAQAEDFAAEVIVVPQLPAYLVPALQRAKAKATPGQRPVAYIAELAPGAESVGVVVAVFDHSALFQERE